MRRIPRVMIRSAIAVVLVALAGAGRAAAEGQCQLLVISRPAGGTIHIDGEERGESPLTLTGLEVGRHDVKVVLEGHFAWTKRVQLRPGGNTVEATLEKKVAPAPAAGDGGDGAPAGKGEEPEGAGTREPGKGPAVDKTPADEAPADGADGKVPRAIPVPCPCCEGKGVIDKIGCVACDTDGYDGVDPCFVCKGTGRRPAKCPACVGQCTVVAGGKRIECRACAGKGQLLCPLCKSTGTILRPNPEAAGYPTTACLSCSGSGAEQQDKCRRCGGRGTIDVSSALYYGRAPCRCCGGDGVGPPVCMQCRGRGYRKRERSQDAIVPCRYCYGTGRLFPPCRNCRGAGWLRER